MKHPTQFGPQNTQVAAQPAGTNNAPQRDSTEQPIALHKHHPPHHHAGPHHPPHHPPHHMPPHIWGASIQVKYEEGMETLQAVYGEGSYTAVQVIEKAPPEMKVTLALVLGLKVEVGQMWDGFSNNNVVFPPFDKATTSIISKALSIDEQKVDAIFEGAPPEVLSLAIAIAHANQSK